MYAATEASKIEIGVKELSHCRETTAILTASEYSVNARVKASCSNSYRRCLLTVSCFLFLLQVKSFYVSVQHKKNVKQLVSACRNDTRLLLLLCIDLLVAILNCVKIQHFLTFQMSS